MKQEITRWRCNLNGGFCEGANYQLRHRRSLHWGGTSWKFLVPAVSKITKSSVIPSCNVNEINPCKRGAKFGHTDGDSLLNSVYRHGNTGGPASWLGSVCLELTSSWLISVEQKMAKLLHLDQTNESSDSNSTHAGTDNTYIRNPRWLLWHVFAASPQPSSSLDKPAGTMRTASEEF